MEEELVKTKQQRFTAFENAVDEAIGELLCDVPTDITVEDVDEFLGRIILGDLIKQRLSDVPTDITIEAYIDY